MIERKINEHYAKKMEKYLSAKLNFLISLTIDRKKKKIDFNKFIIKIINYIYNNYI